MHHIKEIYEDVGTVEGHRGAKGLVFGHVYGKAFFNLQHGPKIHSFATSIRRNHKNILFFFFVHVTSIPNDRLSCVNRVGPSITLLFFIVVLPNLS